MRTAACIISYNASCSAHGQQAAAGGRVHDVLCHQLQLAHHHLDRTLLPVVVSSVWAALVIQCQASRPIRSETKFSFCLPLSVPRTLQPLPYVHACDITCRSIEGEHIQANLSLERFRNSPRAPLVSLSPLHSNSSGLNLGHICSNCWRSPSQ